MMIDKEYKQRSEGLAKLFVLLLENAWPRDSVIKTIDEVLANNNWSDLVMDSFWSALKKMGVPSELLLYTFSAALKAGDIKPMVDITNLDTDELLKVKIGEHSAWAEESEYYAVVCAEFDVGGQIWETQIAYTASDGFKYRIEE